MIDELIAASSIGQGLADIKARGIDAHLEDLEAEMAPKKKRTKGKSPTSRTLDECRKRGWIAGVVEQFVRFPPPGHRVDLFGVLDLIAIEPAADAPVRRCGADGVDDDGHCTRCGLRPEGEAECPPEFFDPAMVVRGAIIGIQACAGASHAARRDKILAERRARAWIEAGGRLELWSWALQGARGKAKRWQLRCETYAEMVAGASEGA